MPTTHQPLLQSGCSPSAMLPAGTDPIAMLPRNGFAPFVMGNSKAVITALQITNWNHPFETAAPKARGVMPRLRPTRVT
eukprot:scaffold572787_cov55-Prasinocladus_malaysianus.AAC.1